MTSPPPPSQWEIDGVKAGWENIGGHSNAAGSMRVYRTPYGITKVTDDDYNRDALTNEAEMLVAMTGSGFTPALIAAETDGTRFSTLQEDVGITEPIEDGEKFRRHMIKLVDAIRSRGLRHGDLTAPNLVFHDSRPSLLDWQESHTLDVPGPQKQQWSDSFMAMRVVGGTACADGQTDTPRVARRWLAVLTELGATLHLPPMPLRGKTFVDFGCYAGDFPALASIEGMNAWGVDAGGFRSGENSIEIGRELWWDLERPPTLVEMDIFDWIAQTDIAPGRDISMMFSTFPYLVQQRGLRQAEALVEEVIRRSEVFFFETQLAGDGPGIPQHQNLADVYNWLLARAPEGATVKEIISLPVTGRPATRTVYAVRKANPDGQPSDGRPV